MFRTAFVLAALTFAPAALACGGADCGHCDKSKTTAQVDDVDAADGTKVTLSVDGMKCGACSKKITAALKGLDGVNAAAVNHEDGTAKVAFDESKTNIDALIEAIGTAGGFTASQPEA